LPVEHGLPIVLVGWPCAAGVAGCLPTGGSVPESAGIGPGGDAM